METNTVCQGLAYRKIKVMDKEFKVIRKEIKMIENRRNTQKRMGMLAVTMALVAFSLLAGCAGSPEQASAPKPGALSGTRFELSLQPGPEYAKDMKVFLFKYTVWPQVAVWLERPDGSFVDTLYVTELAVTRDYRAA